MLYEKEKNIYKSSDMKNVLDNREVWKTKKPFLSDKNIIFSQISIEKK